MEFPAELQDVAVKFPAELQDIVVQACRECDDSRDAVILACERVRKLKTTRDTYRALRGLPEENRLHFDAFLKRSIQTQVWQRRHTENGINDNGGSEDEAPEATAATGKRGGNLPRVLETDSVLFMETENLSVFQLNINGTVFGKLKGKDLLAVAESCFSKRDGLHLRGQLCLDAAEFGVPDEATVEDTIPRKDAEAMRRRAEKEMKKKQDARRKQLFEGNFQVAKQGTTS